MKIMLTGGTGFIGGRVARALIARGDEVVAMVRDPARAAGLAAAGATIMRGDVGERASLAQAVEGADAVVHAAGVPMPAPRRVFQAVHVEGTANLVAAARAAGVKRLVNIASDAVVFSGSDLEDIDESQPYPKRYIDPYSETKALGERAALRAHEEGVFEVTSLRPGIVWGRGDSTVLPIMAKLAAGRFGIPAVGAGDKTESTSHIDNVTGAVLAALDEPHARGRAYFLPDPFEVTWRDFLARQVEAAGIAPKFISLPAALVLPAARAVDRGAGALGLTVPLAAFGMHQAATSRSYATTRIRDDLSFAPAVGLEEGLADLARWIQEIGGANALIALARV